MLVPAVPQVSSHERLATSGIFDHGDRAAKRSRLTTQMRSTKLSMSPSVGSVGNGPTASSGCVQSSTQTLSLPASSPPAALRGQP